MTWQSMLLVLYTEQERGSIATLPVHHEEDIKLFVPDGQDRYVAHNIPCLYTFLGTNGAEDPTPIICLHLFFKKCPVQVSPLKGSSNSEGQSFVLAFIPSGNSL